MSTHHVTSHNFSVSSDEQLIEAARRLVMAMPDGPDRQRAKRGVLSRRPDVRKAGKLVWAALMSGQHRTI